MNDGVFTTHVFRHKLTTNAFRIVPLGDIHRDATAHCERSWKSTLADLKKRDTPNTLYLFMGDEHDFVSWSERKAIAAAKLHDSTLQDLDRGRMEKCREFLSEISWMSPRIVFWIQGNHYWQFLTNQSDHGICAGKTSTQWLADQTKSKWAGYINYTQIEFSYHGSCYPLHIVACHGKAGGKLVGTPINQLDDMRRIFPGADIYLMGHDHKRGGLPDSRLDAVLNAKSGELEIKQKRQWLARTGSFLRGYIPDTGSYVVQAMMKPTEIGHVEFTGKVVHYTAARRAVEIQLVS